MPNTAPFQDIRSTIYPSITSYSRASHHKIVTSHGVRSSKDLAAPLLPPRDPRTAAAASRGCWASPVACGCLPLLVAGIVCYDCVDGLLEDLVDADHFFTAALHVAGVHLPRYAHALLGGDGCETLGFEEVDTGAFRAEI